jgi:hypothetical protein
MRRNQLEARTESPHSVFPAAEPASFCSRPTPVVPANPELHAGAEAAPPSERPAARPSTPSGSISDRPTFVPDDYIEPRRESPPSVTIEEEPASQPRESARLLDAPPPSPHPSLPVAPPAAAARAVTLAPRTRRRRVYLARALFCVLFGAVGSLLGYAFRSELTQAGARLHAGAHARASVK